MLNLLNAVKSLLKIEEAINQGVNDRAAWVFGNTVGLDSRRYLVTVSYTHLTLPTSDLV